MLRPALATLLIALARLAAAGPAIDFLYVEANEGGSSGGHAALRLGDATFHFQRDPSGLLRLARDRSADFERRYRVLQNRTIHASRIPVSHETFALVLDTFSRRQQAQAEQLACLDALQADERLLDAMVARRRGLAGETRIAGSGFFLDAASATVDPVAGPAEPALVALRAEVERIHGPAFLAGREAALLEQLRALAPDSPMPP